MRPIKALKAFNAAPEHFGPVPELRWLPIAALVVDDAYQRPIVGRGKTNVLAIASGFSWVKFAPVVVCPVQGGTYAIVDGQHRTTAALMIGIDSVPCLIIQADRKQQAASFRAINGNTTKVNRLSIYKAAVAAGEPEALAVEAAIREADVTIIIHCCAAKDLKPGHTMASGTIGACIAKYGHALTVLTLKAVRASEGDSGGSLQSKIIAAAALALFDHPGWREDKRLFEAFEDLDLVSEMEDAFLSAKRKGAPKAADLLYCSVVGHLDTWFSNPRRAGAGAALR
jgi:hypothetical protein